MTKHACLGFWLYDQGLYILYNMFICIVFDFTQRIS